MAVPEPKPVTPTVAVPEAKPVTPTVATPEAKPVTPTVAVPEPKPVTPTVAAPEPKPVAPVAAVPEAKPAAPEPRSESPEPSAAPRGTDFTFPDGGLQLPNGEKSRAKANLDAIGILRKLETEQRPATAEEQSALARFVGWGGLSGIFDETKADWAPLRAQLKETLSEEEYAAAQKSTLNAHYTSQDVISALYDALEHIGFRGGRVLEPSAGIGHFAGAMPANLRANSRWTMVELDPVTGGIAKALYPNADVRVQGFETALLPDNYYDAAISNVPFGDIRIHDRRYKPYLTRSIHNYFFVKALDKVRPGGVVAFVTSRYTMDSTQAEDVRRYLGTKADLLGAVRLPDTAFRSNAGTDVVTDILILKKRAPDTPYAGEKFAEAAYRSFTGKDGYVGGYVNEYFTAHPEMVLGTPGRGKMYGRGDSLTYRPKDTDKSLKEQITEAFSTVTGVMDYPAARTPVGIRHESVRGKTGGLVKKDGKIYRNTDGKLVEASDIPKNSRETVGDILSIRDVARTLLDFQRDGAPEKQITASRKGLNALYDDFVKKNGPLHLPKNQRLVKLDPEAPFIFSLEKYDKDTKTAAKADLFTKNTIAPTVAVSHAESVEDALAVNLNETGTVDPERIAALTGETPDAVTKAMLERGLVFRDRDGNLETAERYLSGNVRAKLKDAEALAPGNPEYERNVEALKKIIPADIEPENIKVQIGATWVPEEVYSGFAGELSGAANGVRVTYNAALGEYRVEVANAYVRQRLKNSVGNTTKWGTKDRTFLEILSATLNNKDLNVWRKRADGSRILDTDATEAVRQKGREIQNEFQNWLFRDPERRDTLARLYNDVFNNSVTPRYDGSKLTIDGMNTGITLNPHQKNAVHRIVNSGGNTLLAHRVGAGKTYEMAAAAMKLRQLGVVRKPMFVVPKSLTGQWGREFLDLFPAAKILVPGDDFTAAKRKEYVNRIATGDYDAVILSYEQFKAIPMSDEARAEFIKGQIEQLAAALEVEKVNKTGRTPSVKQMEKKKANLEAELQKLMDKKEDTDNINFEALGVDSLFVDEAHNFKNLFYTTHMNNVTGLGNKEGSQQAFDLLMKVRYLQKLNGGRGIVFATATPVMNSVVEMYTMQNYLQPEALAARNIHNFDAWANQFAEVRTELQISPSGQGGRLKDTLSRYNNLNVLQQMTTQFIDTVTEIPGLKIPKMKGGKRIVVECEPSAYQLDYMKSLADRAERLKSRRVDPKVDNILKIGNDGRKISYSQRVMDHSLPYEPDGKIMKCAEKVAQIWKETADRKGTQIIFCDYSTPKAGGIGKGAATELEQAEAALEAKEDAEAVTIYRDMKNILTGMGIPADEIAFIHDAKNVEQRNQLFDAVRKGKVRVLMGSTGKMGVGMNAQDRVAALHHLDAPQRPGDVEQREGRALRQGNMNDEVGVYVYVTKNTFDARSWDILQRKWTFIVQLQSGDFTGNSFEGDSDVLSAAEIKAIASGNPLIQEQFELTADIARLEGLERAHRRETFAAQDRLRAARAAIAADTESVRRLKADIAARRDTSGKRFSVTLDGRTLTERKAAGTELVRLSKKFLNPGKSPEATKKIGTFAGFDLLTASGGDLILRGEGQYRIGVNFESPAGTVQSLEAAARKLDSTLSAAENRLEANRNAVPELEKASAASFAQAAELEEKRKRFGEIIAELSDERKPSAEETASGDGTAAFREAWEIVDDDSGVLKFREASAAKLGSHPDRWTAERVGDMDTIPKPVQDIVTNYSRLLGIHVGVGHIRGARGQYTPKDQEVIGTGGVRTKVSNDLPVIMHEFAHGIDDKYHLSDPIRNAARNVDEEVRLSKEGQETIRERLNIRQELLSNLDPAFAKQYSQDKLVSEGMAEFFRKFTQNSEKAQAEYPHTYQYVMRSLSGKDQAILLAMANDVNAYYSLDAETAQNEIRPMNERRPDERSFKERFTKGFDRFAMLAYDSLRPVRKASQAMKSDSFKKFYNALNAASQAEALLMGDLRDMDGAYVGPGLKAAWSGINLNDTESYNDFGEYMVSRHGPSWIVREQRVMANDRKNTASFFVNREMKLAGKYPDTFKNAFEKYKKWKHDFNWHYLVESGLLSQEGLKAWKTLYPDYVPMFRVLDGTEHAQKGIASKRLFANQDVPTKAARGSGLMIINPIDGIIAQVPRIVQSAVHNRAMLDFINAARKYGMDAAVMEQIPVPLVKRTADVSGLKVEITNALRNSNLSKEVMEQIIEIVQQQGDILEMFQAQDTPPPGCISVHRNGELEWYKVNDPLLLEALTSTGRPQMEATLKFISDITRKTSALQTGWKLTWALLSNPPRDLLTALVYSGSWKHRVNLIPNMFYTYRQEILHKLNSPNVDPLYLQYLSLGGDTQNNAWSVDRDLSQRIREQWLGHPKSRNPGQWGKNILKDSVRVLEFISNFFEMGPRFATFKMCMQDGMDPHSAIYAAHEITVNFSKGGKWSRFANIFVKFANAATQGLAKIGETVVTVGPTGIAAYLGISLLGAVIEYFWNTYEPEREKSYERLSTYVKNAYFNFYYGDGQYWSIPKNRELAVPMNFFRAALERYVGGNPHAFDDFWNYAATTALPPGMADLAVGDPEAAVGGLTLIGPIFDLARNADFRGVPIESTKERDLLTHDRYNGATFRLSKFLGDVQEKIGVPEKLQISPKKIDYLGSNTLGAPWQYLKAVFPVDNEYRDFSLGVRSQYFKDSLYSNTIIDRLYDLSDLSGKQSKSDIKNVDKKVTAYFDDAMTEFYSRYNALASKEESKTEAARDLRDLVLTMADDYLQAREDGTRTAAQEMVYAVCRKAGDTSKMLPPTRPTAVTDGNGAGHNLTAAQYYDYQGNFNALYWKFVTEALPQVKTDTEKQFLLEKAVDAAGDMAKNNVLLKLGVTTTDDYKKYEELQLYSIPVSTYLAVKARTKDIVSLKDKRTEKTLTHSQEALIAEAVLKMDLDLPETNLRKLMELSGVGKTVLDWKRSRLERELRNFRKDAGVE